MKRQTRWLLAVTTLIGGVAIGVLVGVASGVLLSATRAESGNFTERVNGTCKNGYHLSDWRLGDEFDMPDGVVFVICTSDNRNEHG